MSEPEPRLTVTVENVQPLDVLDLTASLAAIADEYRRYTGDESARLCVERITEGSVVAQLAPLFTIATPLVPIAMDTVAPFLGHWSGLLTGLANYGRSALADADIRRADKASLRNARSFVQPAINGNTVNVQGDGPVTQWNITINAEKAGDIARNAAHLLAGPLPDEDRFENEPMTLYQVRDAKAGDMGYIDRFDKRPRRLAFANEEVKDAVLHAEASPFDVFFFVSGIVKTAGGEVASYLINKINGVTSKDAA